MSKAKKPTPAQRAVLENLAAGRPAGAHLRTMSDHGGFTATSASLYRNRWIDDDGITPAGLAAIGKAATKPTTT